MRATPELEEQLFRLHDFRRALQCALEIVQKFGDHWSTCNLNKGGLCSCGYFEAKQELKGLVPQ